MDLSPGLHSGMASPRVGMDPLEGQRHRVAERPFLLTGLVVATVGVVALSAGLSVVAFTWSADAVELAAEFVLAVVVVVVVTRMRWWRVIGFHRLRTMRDLRFFWIPLFPVLMALPAAVAALAGLGPTRALERLAFWLVLAALIGFVEEVCFRGLVLRALAPRGIWLAAVASSILFGLMHVVNLLFGAGLDATLLQVGDATAMGFAFAAVVLRTGVVWPLVVIHALVDVVAFAAADATTATDVTGGDVLVSAVYAAMFTVYGILVLRGLRASPDGSVNVEAATSQGS